MDVAKAVMLAKKYTKPRDDRYAVIRFEPGVVSAQTEGSGIVIACPDVSWSVAVDAAQLVAMVKKAGDNPAFSVDRNALVLRGSGEYRLKGLEPKAVEKLPSAPESPRRFVELDEATFRLVVQVAGLALAGDDDPSLGAVRLNPSWAASSRGNGLAIAWLVNPDGSPLGLVREPATVDARFLSGLRGAHGIGMSKAFFWLQAGDVKRWARRLEAPWPDSAVSGENLDKLRNGGANRGATAVDPRAMRTLFDRALAAADSKADTFRFTWGSAFALTGGGQRGRFQGEVPAAVDGGGRTFGVAPAVWLRYLDALAACCDGEVYLSLAGPTDPAALWGLQPRALEVFVWPEYVPA